MWLCLERDVHVASNRLISIALTSFSDRCNCSHETLDELDTSNGCAEECIGVPWLHDKARSAPSKENFVVITAGRTRVAAPSSGEKSRDTDDSDACLSDAAGLSGELVSRCKPTGAGDVMSTVMPIVLRASAKAVFASCGGASVRNALHSVSHAEKALLVAT